jgi:site-specific recombinase XerD
MGHTSGKQQWAEIVSEFEEYLFHLGRSQNSINSYGLTLKGFGQFYRTELKKTGPYVSKLHETDLQAFVDYLRTTQYLAASSVNAKIAGLRAFTRYTLEKKLHRRDIGRGLKTYFIQPSLKIPRLTKGETRRLVTSVNLNAKNGLRDLAIIQLLLQCGLRVNEVHNLCIDDAVINKKDGHLRVRDAKTRSERVLPLNASARNALQKYLAIRGDVAGKEPLFLSQHGKRLAVKSIKHLVKKYLCMAGRSDLSARDLRHNLGRGLYEETKDITTVQHMLGHRSIATTIRYIKPTEKEIAVAVEQLPGNVYHEEPEE